MKTCIVTGCDIKYLPGVKALYNSLVQNGNTDCDFYLLAHGDPADFTDLAEGIKCIFNQETVTSPKGGEWVSEIPAMYSRVLIPRIFGEYDRAVWLDADTIVLKDINPLLDIDMEGKPCAASLPAYMDKTLNTMAYQLEEPNKYPEVKDLTSLQAGVVVFDIAEWHKRDLDTVIDNLLQGDVKFKFVVQGLMGMAMAGDFKVLPYTWNCYSNWANKVGISNIGILHFVGGAAQSPWSHNMLHVDIWRQYAE